MSTGEERFAVPWLTLLVVAGVLWGVSQLVPGQWPASESWRQHAELTGHAAEAGDTRNHAAKKAEWPTSLYPASTRRELTLLVLGTGALMLGIFCFQSRQSFVWLCRVMAINGAALALFGILQSLRWDGRLYWVLPIERGAPFGPFVYRNQAGDFLVLCVAAAAGWIVHAFRSHTDEMVNEPISTRFADIVVGLNLAKLAAIGCLVLNVVGVLASMSRGATISLLAAIGTLAIGWVVARAFSFGRQLLLAMSVAFSLAILVWAGLTPQLASRLGTLMDSETVSNESRLEHWGQGWQAAQQFWPWGSGLGTYRFVYRAYDDASNKQWFTHAHNQYLEAIVDGGAPAILLVGLLILTMAACVITLWRTEHRNGQLFATVGAIAVIAESLHSAIDFCLYLSANMLLFAVICGAVAGRAASQSRRLALPMPSWLAKLLPLFCAAGLVWAALETQHASTVDRTLEQLPWKKASVSLTEAELIGHIERLNEIVRSDDAEVHEAMAELWIHVYRVRARKELSVELKVPIDDPNLWEWTSPVVLYSRSHELSGNEPALKDLREQPAVQKNLQPALQHLYLARDGCPLLPRVHLHLAELSFIEAGAESDTICLDRAVRTAAGNPNLWYEVGRLHFAAQRFPAAFQHWQKSLELSDEFRDDILRLAGTQLKDPEISDQLLPHNPRALLRIASSLGEGQESLQRLCLRRARELLGNEFSDSAERSYLRGRVNALEGRRRDAIQDYLRAVEENPKQVDWRFELAKLLLESERLEEAKREARKCLWMNPDRPDFQNLLMEIDRAERRSRSWRASS